MKNHIRAICMIFSILLVVPYITIALAEPTNPADIPTDATEHAVVETVEDIPETEVTEPTVEVRTPVEDNITENQKPILPEAEEILHEPVEGFETPEMAFEAYQHDWELLACVIYQESGGDRSCDDCRRKVADVVLNRVGDPRFPNNIEDVLTEEGQYGNYSRTGVVWPERANDIYEQYAVERAYRIAEEVLSGKHSSLYGEGYIWQATFKQGKDIVYCCGHYYGR